MGMTPDEYLDAFVEGNLTDCRDDPGDLRRAFNAAVSASHLADHHYAYHRRHNPDVVAAFPTLGSFLEHLVTGTDGAFRDLRSISNVYKHLYTDARQLVHASLLSGGALEAVRVPEHNGDIDGIDCDHEKSPDEKGNRWFVRFTRKDGTTGEFLPILESFLKYWYRVHAR